MFKRPKPEILAPAGNFEKMQAAFRYGADAVYMAGQNFGLRAFAANFSRNEMSLAVRQARDLGRKVYVTTNIYAHQEDLHELPDYYAFLDDLRVDGVLISDPGLFRLAQKYAPHIPKQISTQASITNAEACKFWYDLGVRRVVLAREVTLAEIYSIREQIPVDLELEAFVHGAMCVSYSGRCLMSNYLAERDGNRGKCAQPCRWRYRVSDINHPEQSMEVEEDGRGTYLFSSNDLCLIEHIPELVDAGIDSFKIEGRMKGAYYAAIVTKTYREALDAYWQDPQHYQTAPEAMKELCSMVHRTYSTGFYFDKPKDHAQIFSEATYMKEAVVLAVVLEMRQDGSALCEQRNKMFAGETVQVIRPVGPTLDFNVDKIQTPEGEILESTPHPMMQFVIYPPEPLAVGSFIRRLGDKDRDPDAAVGNCSSCSSCGE